ncbi:hypothetical protein [Actinoplanes siamensis]|uniref:Uncharacterized protein n=1 Tax=Actinoplanes siamensis TaxID=1223317 RepID=A0A919N6D1_9ACTN|nr:hypothetical protein [Actinoplanes siamensis]GIF05195.1 hypothetical protein Asi03nite_27330 [Actinoplanes siamensis]
MTDPDRQLHHKVDAVQQLVLRLEEGVGQVSLQVAGVGQRTEEVNSQLQLLARSFEEYVLKAERTANAQRAETRIGVIEAQIEHRFGHYKVVRRVARGMLQGFDVGLVSDETLRDVGEQLMVETPGYWLAPVLVALQAWLADDQATCERAVQEAFHRSPGRTSLFMALILRRQGRGESSLRWLRHYLAALDPSDLGREFAVILESVSQGAFGPAGIEMVQERLDQWRAQLLSDPAREQAQIQRWRSELEKYVGPPVADRYPRLVAVSPQWPQMDRVLSRAAAHEALINRYSAMAVEEPAARARIEDQVDDILDLLVTGFDEEELPLSRDLAENHAIVKHGGDLAAARRDLDTDLLALDKRHDYLTTQSESALNPDKLGVSRATQRMAVSSCHEWFAQAHAQYSRDYRTELPADVEAVFESDHNLAGVAFRLPRWTGSFTRPIEALERSLAEHWDRAGRPFVDSLAYNWQRNLIAPGAVVLVLLLCGFAQPIMLVAALLVGAVWGGVLWYQAQNQAAVQQQARDFLERAKVDSIQQLRGGAAELADWTTAFRQADGREAAVRAVVADLATAGSPATPYERRVAHAGTRTGA